MITLVHKNNFFEIGYPEFQDIHPNFSKPGFKWLDRIVILKVVLCRCFSTFGKKYVDQLVFILKINVEGAGCHACFFGYLAHGYTC